MNPNIKRSTLFLFVAFAFSNLFSQNIDHWETIIRVGDSARYFVPSSEIGTNWITKDFDDSEWLKAKSGFGYGDADDNTVLPNGTMSVYMRFTFSVENISDIAALMLDMDYDDGFVAYLNGDQIARSNVQEPITWNMELNEIHEAVMYSGVNPERFDLDRFINLLLVEGKNVLAVEVHNESASSSDMSANVFLHAGISKSDLLYGPVPYWFEMYTPPTEFNLPLMIINTNGQTIPAEPRIVADMGLVFNGEGMINSISDVWNEYDGKISIETRGESSIGFAKKSYSIELQKADGSNNNVALLGLPVENDFVLYGPYSDKTLMKNVLSYEIFRRTGRWAPRTRYIEVIVNGDYGGVYVLTEKLKRDENRVDIDKMSFDDYDSASISGGYILRRDKKDKLTNEMWWQSPVVQPYHETMWYEYFDPDYAELNLIQKEYIKDWMKNFDETISGSEFAHPINGYRGLIKVKSFIDMMFLNEISKGIDNYLFSTYFHKENDEDGGQLVAGPPWDYNLGYGNLNYGDGWDAKETYGWCYPQGGRVYWFERLMEDENYRERAYCRWTKFRETIYSNENMIAIIDSCVDVLGDAIDRNFSRYPTLGNYVWPGLEPFPETYEEEVSNLKVWLLARLEWMDTQWLNAGICSDPPTDITLSVNSILENLAIGTLIGEFSTTDYDSEKHNYYFAKGKGDEDNSGFSIENNRLLSNKVFSYPTQSLYSIRVQSEDESSENIEKIFTINILKDGQSGIGPSSEISFVIAPNPSSEGVQIIMEGMEYSPMAAQIYELSGKVLFNYNGLLQEINSRIMEDTESLSPGIYFLSVIIDGQKVTRKFVKY